MLQEFKTLKVRILDNNPYEIFGLIEALTGCSYRMCGIKWVSSTAEVWEIKKDSFFKYIGKKLKFIILGENSPKIIKSVIEKLTMIQRSIERSSRFYDAKINKDYYKSLYCLHDSYSRRS